MHGLGWAGKTLQPAAMAEQEAPRRCRQQQKVRGPNLKGADSMSWLLGQHSLKLAQDLLAFATASSVHGASGSLPLTNMSMGKRSCRKGREEFREWICPEFGCLCTLRKHHPPAALRRVCLLGALGQPGAVPGCGEQREGVAGPCVYSQQRNKEQRTKRREQRGTES